MSGKETKYEPIIGLEIHVQLKTKSKMFCSCDNTGEDQPINTTICPVCTGQPGAMPVPNQQAIDWGVMVALALKCRILNESKFDRKSYFYPDLPKGYQISQYDQPVGVDGYVVIQMNDHVHRVGITRLHLEEDAAKLLHPTGATDSLVDFNRAGTPLAEIVTEPDIRTPAEARIFLQELRLMMRYVGVSDADMEKGHLRCDANISLRPRGEVTFYPKTEVKNLNSFRSVERALQYEIERQTEDWENGSPDAVQSTRGWDEAKQQTVLQRTKEDAADYRYFPEPDIPPLQFTSLYLRDLTSRMPELPAERRERFAREYNFLPKDVEVLVNQKRLGDFAEAVLSELRAWILADAKDWGHERTAVVQQAANWLINRYQRTLTDQDKQLSDEPVTAENMAEFIKIVTAGKINSQVAQQVLEIMIATGGDPSHIIEEKGLGQIEDEELLNHIVQHVLDENQDVVQDVRGGKHQALQFLVGKVMAATQGKANPQQVRVLLQDRLK